MLTVNDCVLLSKNAHLRPVVDGVGSRNKVIHSLQGRARPVSHLCQAQWSSLTDGVGDALYPG